ncbi:MAG: preprotein translocase subunit SecG [Myxococcaceae bacterium]|jgi:preprotein translocase subunit SecG|nr:preprotein translocase subunit SecG [Myxococcaceae bacterium]
MLAFFTTIHVLLCIFMIFVILLQPGKDAGMGAALGGGAASSAFGGRGAVTFLTKVTAVCAVAFFVTSLGLSLVGLKTSLVEKSSLVAKQQEKADKEKAEKDKADAEKAAAPTTGTPTEVKPGEVVAPQPAQPPADAPKATDAVPSEKAP